MELEEHEGVDPVIERRCAECGATLTDAEIRAALETKGPFLCTVHANEEVSLEEDVEPYDRSSSATHSMCGVCGNMSTGRTVLSS